MFEEQLDKKIKNLNEKIDAVQSVKSVQRGTCALGTSGADVEVKINKIDVNKSMILLHGSGYHSEKISTSYIYSSTGVYVSNVTEESFIITQQLGSSSSKSISWQVIEFY